MSDLAQVVTHYVQLVCQRAGVNFDNDCYRELHGTIEAYVEDVTTSIAALNAFTTDEIAKAKADIIRLERRFAEGTPPAAMTRPVPFLSPAPPSPHPPTFAVRVGPWHLSIEGKRVRYGVAPGHFFEFLAPVEDIVLRADGGDGPPRVFIYTRTPDSDCDGYWLDGAHLGPAGWTLVRIDKKGRAKRHEE